MREQIFISYRREGGDVTAKLICEALKNRGYTVFYDYDSLKGGYFDDKIFKAIERCNDFVVVLPENSLDRCVNENDWVRQEIAHALKSKKNIIPIMLPEFEFPNDLPKDIEDISRINGIRFIMDYFETVIDTITKRITSTPLIQTIGPQNSNLQTKEDQAVIWAKIGLACPKIFVKYLLSLLSVLAFLFCVGTKITIGTFVFLVTTIIGATSLFNNTRKHINDNILLVLVIITMGFIYYGCFLAIMTIANIFMAKKWKKLLENN